MVRRPSQGCGGCEGCLDSCAGLLGIRIIACGIARQIPGLRGYNNNTPVLSFTPVSGDIAAPDLANPADSTPFGHNKKNVELTGNWYFAKKSSMKVGYEREIMDRSHSDVAHATENGFVTAVDAILRKDLSFRVSYRYSIRNPEQHADDQAASVSGGITNDQTFSRRFDEAARTRNRGDVQIMYDPTDWLSFSAGI